MQSHTPSSDTGCVKVLFRNPYHDFYGVVVLHQVVHLTQEWMEKKLQTYFKRDTGCLYHNMWMQNCKFSFFDSFSFVEKGNVP